MKLYKCSNCLSKELQPIKGIHKMRLVKIVDIPGLQCQNCGHHFFDAETILAVEKTYDSFRGFFRFGDLELKKSPTKNSDYKINCPDCGKPSDFVCIYYKFKDTTLVNFPMGRCASCANFFLLLDLSYNMINHMYNENTILNRTFKINKLGILEIEDAEDSKGEE